MVGHRCAVQVLVSAATTGRDGIKSDLKARPGA